MRLMASYGNPSQFYHNLKRKLCYNINIRLPSTDGRLERVKHMRKLKYLDYWLFVPYLI